LFQVVPVKRQVPLTGNNLLVWLPPMSVNVFEFPLALQHMETRTTEIEGGAFEKIAIV
jgi:hypothetical protein